MTARTIDRARSLMLHICIITYLYVGGTWARARFAQSRVAPTHTFTLTHSLGAGNARRRGGGVGRGCKRIHVSQRRVSSCMHAHI